MVDRKVSVALELHAGQYKGEAKAASRATEDLADRVEELDHDITRIPPDASRAALALKLLGGEADSASRSIGNIGDKHTNLAALDAKIRSTRTEVRKLADEFARTGDIDVFKRLGDSQGKLSALTKIRKDIAESITDGARDAAQSPELRQIGMALGGALAVPLLAALGGALAGVTGLSVAGVGLAGAVLGDPEKFQGAWGDAIFGVKRDFLDATAPFSDEVLDGISRIGPLVHSWHLAEIFKDAKGYADPLFDGVQDLTTGLVRGVGALVSKGGPAVRALSEGMTILGAASEDAMKSIADGAEGGAYALKDLATGVGGAIRLFGGLTEAAERTYGFLHDHQEFLVGALGFGAIPFAAVTAAGENRKVLKEAAGSTDALAASQRNLREETARASDALRGQLTEWNKYAGIAVDSTEAAIALQDAEDKLADGWRKGAGALDITNAKGRENVQLALDAVKAAEAVRDAAIAAGNGTVQAQAEANAAYEKTLQSIEDMLVNMGLARDAAHAFVQQYDGRTVTMNLRVNGTVHWNDEVGISVGNLLHHAAGGIRHAATGMIVAPSNPGTLIGEPQTGGEALIPMQGIAASQAAWLGQTALSGYGYNVVPRSVRPGGGGMPSELTLNATFLDPHTGDVMRKQAITWSINRGRNPADFFTAA